MRRRDNGNSGLVSPSGGSYRVVILIGHRVTVHVQSWIRAISTVRRKVSTIFYYFRNKLINLSLSNSCVVFATPYLSSVIGSDIDVHLCINRVFRGKRKHFYIF